MVNSQNAGSINLGQICDVFDYFSNHWIYLQDPFQQEYFAKATASMTNMRGDCDDYAIALATALRTIGACTRIVGAYNETEGHAYAQVCIGDTNWSLVNAYLQKRYPINGTAYSYTTELDEWGNEWLNLDQLHPFPGGPVYPAATGFVFVLGRPNLCIRF